MATRRFRIIMTHEIEVDVDDYDQGQTWDEIEGQAVDNALAWDFSEWERTYEEIWDLGEVDD